MKRISYKSILLILCLSMFISALSLSFVRADLSMATPGGLTETIVVFDEEPCTWGDHAIADITIKDWPIESVHMKMKAHLDSSDIYLRAIVFRLDGRGECIDAYRYEKFQTGGYGVISPGQTKLFPAGANLYDMSYCKFAKAWPGTGSQWLNFIPEDPSQTVGYFSPGVHTIDAYVTTPRVGSWISITLEITYKLIPATVDFDPDTLNQKSKGKWVTVYIGLPEGYDVNDIDIESVRLDGLSRADSSPTEISDDGILMVKFDREAVIDLLEPGENVLITISGNLDGGLLFEGTDTIRVIH